MDAGWGVLMMVGMTVFWVAVAVVLVWLVRTVRTPQPQGGPGSLAGPERILAERLAKGEIDVAEYETRLAALQPPR